MNKSKFIPIDKEFTERFLSKLKQIEDGDNCWVWKWSKTSKGYGGTSYKKSRFLAHRVSFFLFFNKLDSNLVLDHICSNRLCVNPKHLQEVSVYENFILEKERKDFFFSRSGPNRTNLPVSLFSGICKRNHKITNLTDFYVNKKDKLIHFQCKLCRNRNNPFYKQRDDKSPKFDVKQYAHNYYLNVIKPHRNMLKCKRIAL